MIIGNTQIIAIHPITIFFPIDLHNFLFNTPPPIPHEHDLEFLINLQ